MSLFGQVWLWSAAAFVLGVLLTWLFLVRPAHARNRLLERQLLAAQTAAAPERQPSRPRDAEPDSGTRTFDSEPVLPTRTFEPEPEPEPEPQPEPVWHDVPAGTGCSMRTTITGLTPSITKRYRLDEGARALRDLAREHTVGKLVVVP